jgi:four helix bundle protein
MNQWREEMKARTHAFAVGVVILLDAIPDRAATLRLKDQLAGAAAGVDLNWRAACRARSHKEFTARLGTVLEEADEAEACLDTMWDARLCVTDEARRLRTEAKELRSIFARAALTAEENERANRPPKHPHRRP